MNHRERFLAFARFQPVDRVPRYALYVPDTRQTMKQVLGKDPYDFFDADFPGTVAMQPPAGDVRPDYSVYYPDRQDGQNGFRIDHNGVGCQHAGFHHFSEFISPLKNIESFDELTKFPIPDKSLWSDEPFRQAKKEADAKAHYTRAWIGHMYEDAWQIRGYEEFLMDLMAQRDWAEYLLDRICTNNLISATAAAKAGFDCICTGDDVANQNAMMFQPELWRDVMKPRWAKVMAAARAIKPDIQIWYHSDGNIAQIVDDLIEIGVTILNPVQPECLDPIALRKRYGKRLAFDGCIGTQTTFPFASPDQMKKTVIDLANALDSLNGGLTLSPTHVLEPDVPPQNVLAFFEACDQIHRHG